MKKKAIEIILREMIYECEKLGREPETIQLTNEAHVELLESLKQFTKPRAEKYQITLAGVTHVDQPPATKVYRFMDIPVEIGDETKVLWKLD